MTTNKFEPDLSKFKGRMPGVKVVSTAVDSADDEGTKLLLEQYTEAGVFKCPRCGAEIKNRDDAVAHLAEEINKAFRHLGDRRPPSSGSLK